MAAPGVAVPGSVVAVGSQASPAGAQGIGGTNAITTTSAGFTVPAIGSTVSATVNDASWIVVGQMVYVDQAGGPGQAGVLQVTAKVGNTLTLLNPTPAPVIPPADTTQPGLLKQLSGNTTDFVDGTNTCQNLVAAVQPTIWSARLRSFNAIGNPTFEVDQKLCGAVSATSGFGPDRWKVWVTGSTMTANRIQAAIAGAPITVPGTNFGLTNNMLRTTLTAQQASLAATDSLYAIQSVEGPRFRELAKDVHSISLLVNSSVANLKFAVALNSPDNSRSLVKLCTLGAPGYTMIQLPNIPVWDSGGNFSGTPGVVGYGIRICVAAGSTYIAPATDVWQTGLFFGASGMDNFASKPVNSTFDIVFIQHEPGALCTTPIDCPFGQNLDDCLRYYQKTYDYTVAAGTVTTVGLMGFTTPVAGTVGYGTVKFHKPLAKTPTMTFYNYATGAANSIRDQAGTDHSSATALNLGTSGFGGVSFTPATAAATGVWAHYTAETTGW